MKRSILVFLLFNVCTTIAGQPLPDSVRIKYNAGPNASAKGKVLFRYLEPLQDDPSFLTTAAHLNEYFKANRDETGQEYLQVVVNNQLARTGDYTIALKLLLRQLSQFKNKKDDYGVLLTTRFIGAAYNFAKDFDNTILYDKKAIELAVAMGYKQEIAHTNNNLGSDYAEYNMPDSGLRYAQIGVQFAREADDPRTLSTAVGTLGEVYIGLKQYDKALPLLRESLALGRISSNVLIANWVLNDYAQIYYETGNQDSARHYAYKAAALAKEKGFQDQLFRAYQYLYASYEKSGLKDSAFAYFKMSTKTKDSLYSLQKSKQVQAINFREQVRQQEAEQEIIHFRNRIRTYAMLIGLGIFFMIAFMLYRNNRKEKKANKILENTLSNLKTAQSQLIQSEKMASLGELTAGIAHEIQNPLNFVNNFSEVNKELLVEMNEEIEKGNLEEVKSIAKDVTENEEKINHHGKRADAIVKGMLQHSRTSSGVKEPTDINALCDEYLRLAYHGLLAKDKSFNASIKTKFDETIGNISIIPQDIGRAILNLINNAFYAVDARLNESIGQEKKTLRQACLPDRQAQGDGSYEPTVSLSTKKLGDKIEIKVEDNGNGIPQKVLDKIFQPFFTTKPTGQGTGLGLSLSYDIVKAHGGQITVKSNEGEGTEFSIELPIA